MQAVRTSISKQSGDRTLTIADMLLKRGRKEGREQGRQEGRMEGRQEGRREGRREGRQEGRQEGRREGQIERGKEIALRLLARGFTPEGVSEISGLSLDEVNALG